MIVHSECNGEVVIDQSRYGTVMESDIWFPVKCSKCGAHLGMLTNIQEGKDIPLRRPVNVTTSNRPT